MRGEVVLSTRYVDALLSVLESTSQDKSEVILILIDVIQGIQDVPGVQLFLKNPCVPLDKKISFLEKISFGEASIFHFLVILLKKQRFSLLPYLKKLLRERYADIEGFLDVSILSTTPLDDADRDYVEQFIRSYLQSREQDACSKKFIFHTKIDAGLVGGIRVEIGHLVFDMSISGSLIRLKSAFE